MYRSFPLTFVLLRAPLTKTRAEPFRRITHHQDPWRKRESQHHRKGSAVAHPKTLCRKDMPYFLFCSERHQVSRFCFPDDQIRSRSLENAILLARCIGHFFQRQLGRDYPCRHSWGGIPGTWRDLAPAEMSLDLYTQSMWMTGSWLRAKLWTRSSILARIWPRIFGFRGGNSPKM